SAKRATEMCRSRRSRACSSCGRAVTKLVWPERREGSKLHPRQPLRNLPQRTRPTGTGSRSASVGQRSLRCSDAGDPARRDPLLELAHLELQRLGVLAGLELDLLLLRRAQRDLDDLALLGRHRMLLARVWRAGPAMTTG